MSNRNAEIPLGHVFRLRDPQLERSGSERFPSLADLPACTFVVLAFHMLAPDGSQLGSFAERSREIREEIVEHMRTGDHKMRQRHWTTALSLVTPLVLSALLAAPFSSCLAKKPQAQPVSDKTAAPALAVGNPAPPFTLPDQDGKPVSLSDFAGKIVVLEWINWDCPWVIRHYEKGTMKSLAAKYRERGIVWLAINSTHYATADKDKAWIAKNSLPYAILADRDGKIGKAYGARTTPHMYVIDAKGTVVYQGAIDDDQRWTNPNPTNLVDKTLRELLAGQPVSQAQTTPYGCSVKYKS
jgi:peroxiredoxin